MLCNQCKIELDPDENVCHNCGAAVPRGNSGFEYINGVKQALKSLIDSYGTDILSDNKKFISFLNDYLPEYDKERRLIKNVINNDVIKNMLKEKDQKISVLKTRDYMINELFLSENAAEFVIECFTYVLGWEYIPANPDRVVQNTVVAEAPKKTQAPAAESSQSAPSKSKEFRAFDALKYKLRGTVEIPDGYTSIDGFCFDSFGFLKAVKLPETMNTIGEYAFSECKRLKTVDLPSSLRIIKKGAFSSCSKLNAVKIPVGVIAIEEGTFSFCHNLEFVEIPATVGNIGSEAFSGCEKLKTLFIPDNVKYICEDAFSLCPSLTIRCYENSYVHKFCIDQGIKVQPLERGFNINV